MKFISFRILFSIGVSLTVLFYKLLCFHVIIMKILDKIHILFYKTRHLSL